MLDRLLARRSRLAACGSFGILVCSGLILWGLLDPIRPAGAATITDRIVAIVNKELIMQSEVRSEIAGEEQRLREQYKGAELQRRIQQLEYIALSRMIERKLQLQWAQARGMEVSEEEVNQAIRQLEKQGERVDENNPRERKALKEQLVMMRVMDREVRSGIMVLQPELERYYGSHQTRFSLPEEYRISQILLKQKAAEEVKEFRKRIASVHAALKNGGDFAEIALQQSEGAESVKGGALGFVRQGELEPEIERVVSGLGPGQISAPIETIQGWHIIRLDEKKPSQFRPFAQVKNEIQGLVHQQKTEDQYQRWMGDIKRKAFIEVKF
ncbi:MAG: peptidylprolyl isomerase [Nitrospirae bacterium]|nr:peptidylprolyl isomerase [Nitrospirota bacterium]